MPFVRGFKDNPIKIHRNQVLSFGPGRKVRGNKLIVDRIVNLTVTLVLLTGCLLQITSIFKLYLRYPTNISIETKFKSYRKPLPAITLCVNIGDLSGQSTDQILRNNSFQDYVSGIIHLESDLSLNDLYENFSRNIIESVGKSYFCFTLNSLIKCEFEFFVFQVSISI